MNNERHRFSKKSVFEKIEANVKLNTAVAYIIGMSKC